MQTMKTTLKYSIPIAVAGVLALCPYVASAQSKKAAKDDAASKDAQKEKKSGGKTAPSAPVETAPVETAPAPVRTAESAKLPAGEKHIQKHTLPMP